MRLCDIVSHRLVIGCRCGSSHVLEASRGPLPDYDLQGRYAAFNARLFDGALPEIPIRFGRLKGVGGVVNAKVASTLIRPGMSPSLVRLMGKRAYASRELVPGSLHMVIDSIYERSEEKLDAILLHEMIHVWLIGVEHDFDDDHGPRFLAKARELGQAVGYAIPLTDKVADLAMAPTADKPLGVLLFGDKSGGKFGYAIVSPKALAAGLDAFLARWKGYVPRIHSEVSAYTISSNAWTKKAMELPVQRNLDHRLSRYHLQSDELLSDLRTHGTLLASVEATK